MMPAIANIATFFPGRRFEMNDHYKHFNYILSGSTNSTNGLSHPLGYNLLVDTYHYYSK